MCNVLAGRYRIVVACSLFYAIVAQNLCTFDMVYALNAMVVSSRRDTFATDSANYSAAGVCPRRDPTQSELNFKYERIEWDSATQGLVLGIFGAGAIFGTLISIWIYDIFYLRVVFPAGLFMSACNSLMLPAMSYHGGTTSVVTNRFFSGFYTGVMVPGVAVSTVAWFPLHERGKAQTYIMLGSNFGKLLFALSGYLIANHGWSAMFEVTGSIGVIMAAFVFFIYTDEPSRNVCVTEEEESIIYDMPYEILRTQPNVEDVVTDVRRTSKSGRGRGSGGGGGGYLSTIGNVMARFVRGIRIRKKGRAPTIKWRKVLLSRPYWATVLAHFGVKYVGTASVTYTQIYLQNIHGYSLTRTSVLTSIIPNLGIIIIGYMSGFMNDYLLRKGVPKLWIRRSFGCFMMMSNLMFIVLPLLDCEKANTAIPYLLAITSFRGGIYACVIQSYHDLSPTFHKSLLSLSWCITLIGSVFVPMLMGYIGKDTIAQWNLIYLISACIIGITILIYVLFVDVEIQPWDPEYDKQIERETGRLNVPGSVSAQGEPWYTFNADINLAHLFQSHEREEPNKLTTKTATSIDGIPRSNKVVSILQSQPFVNFGGQFDSLSHLRKEAILRKYRVKSKTE